MPRGNFTSGDDLRVKLKAINPRPGWIARNVESDGGHVFDLMHDRERKGMVAWDWDVGEVSGYIDGKAVHRERCSNERHVHLAMVVVEDGIADASL